MALEEHIDNIRNGLARRQFTSETAVRQGIINPPHASSVSPVDVPPVSDLPRKKSPQRTRVVVTMPDGEIVECPKIRDTFSEVIKKLGVEKVAALGIIRDKIPLVSDSEYPDYAQRQSGSHYINVDAPTPDKKRDLMKIAKDLGVELKVEIIPK